MPKQDSPSHEARVASVVEAPNGKAPEAAAPKLPDAESGTYSTSTESRTEMVPSEGSDDESSSGAVASGPELVPAKVARAVAPAVAPSKEAKAATTTASAAKASASAVPAVASGSPPAGSPAVAKDGARKAEKKQTEKKQAVGVSPPAEKKSAEKKKTRESSARRSRSRNRSRDARRRSRQSARSRQRSRSRRRRSRSRTPRPRSSPSVKRPNRQRSASSKRRTEKGARVRSSSRRRDASQKRSHRSRDRRRGDDKGNKDEKEKKGISKSVAEVDAAEGLSIKIRSKASAAAQKKEAAAALVAASVPGALKGFEAPEKSSSKVKQRPLPWAHLNAGIKSTGRSSPPAEVNGKSTVGAGGLAVLGNITEFQRQIEEDRRKLKLFVIKAKQEWEERRELNPVRGETDNQEYYMACVGETFGEGGRFRVENKIGMGVFSSVFKCKDTVDDADRAVKLVRANPMMRKVSEKEVEMYRHLMKKAHQEDKEGAKYLISLCGPETFEHRGHLCLVFDLLKCDLRFGLQKYGQGKGLPLLTVQQYAKQVFMALRALRKLKVMHCDLKPDNVLMSQDKTSVQLIDFGSATDVADQIRTAYVQPRYYRAPEVMLGLRYDTQIDVWSLGTTIFELATSKILFQGKTNNGMLKLMLETCGAFPRKLARSGEFSKKHFSEEGDSFLCKDQDSFTGVDRVLSQRIFEKPRRPIAGQVEALLKEPQPGMDARRYESMVQRLGDLLTKTCTIDPAERITPEAALAHPFFKTPKVDK